MRKAYTGTQDVGVVAFGLYFQKPIFELINNRKR